MEIEQRYVVSCLHRKDVKLPEIVAELASVYHQEAFDENRVKYWLHEVNVHRFDFSDRPSSGRRPLEETDGRILQVVEAEPWFSIQTIGEFLKIPASMVHLCLTISLNMKSRHLKCVPHFLNDDLKAKRLPDPQQLFDVLKAQQKCHCRDLITGDTTWVYCDMKPKTVWLLTHAEPAVRVKRTIESEKRMMAGFWGIYGIRHSCWLPTDSTLDSPFFYGEVLGPLAQKL
jgi:hypothetical protein